MKTYSYVTKGTCSREILITIEEDENIISAVKFVGGCSGNTQGIGALVAGMNIDDAISRLSGIDCNGKGTSCPDQLAKALTQIKSGIA